MSIPWPSPKPPEQRLSNLPVTASSQRELLAILAEEFYAAADEIDHVGGGQTWLTLSELLPGTGPAKVAGRAAPGQPIHFRTGDGKDP